MCKESGVNYVRLHAEPYPEIYLDVADEMGMLIVDEVKEVLTLEEDCIEKVSSDNKDDRDGFVFAVGKCEDGLVSLLDLNAVALEKE